MVSCLGSHFVCCSFFFSPLKQSDAPFLFLSYFQTTFVTSPFLRSPTGGAKSFQRSEGIYERKECKKISWLFSPFFLFHSVDRERVCGVVKIAKIRTHTSIYTNTPGKKNLYLKGISRAEHRASTKDDYLCRLMITWPPTAFAVSPLTASSRQKVGTRVRLWEWHLSHMFCGLK